MKIVTFVSAKLFELGQIVSTPGALEACSQEHLAQCLTRHATGDWGHVCEEDATSNNEAVKEGHRILSADALDPEKPSKGFGENTLWIITEGDRRRDDVPVTKRILVPCPASGTGAGFGFNLWTSGLVHL